MNPVYSTSCSIEEGRPTKYQKLSKEPYEVKSFLPTDLLLEIMTFVGCEKESFALLTVNRQFYTAFSHYSPIILVKTIRNFRPYHNDSNLYLPSIPVTEKLKTQFALTLAKADPNYEKTKMLLSSYYSSLKINEMFKEMVLNNKSLFCVFLKSNGMMLALAGESVKEDIDLLEIAVKQNQKALEYVPHNFVQLVKEGIQEEIGQTFINAVRQNNDISRSLAAIQRKVLHENPWMKQHLSYYEDPFAELEKLASDHQ